MDRIAIIGLSGSGKSTFANALGKKLNRPIIHLDKEFWGTGWRKKYSKEDWVNFQQQLIEQDKWIIDGNFRNGQESRIKRADTVIFFDFPKWRCLLRVLIRPFDRKQPFDKIQGLKNKTDLKLINYIITYPVSEIRSFIKLYKTGRTIYTVKNNKEIKELLLKLK